ncbi:MAG: iron-sulfur cluster assembly protein [Candidatus Rehaiarchaeum fermentans]|nr:iron-sulfur cluster assembly protein [Candidatus Rehaiarchaeum fermentans]
MITKEEVLEALKKCYDPEIPINVVDLGLVYDIKIDEDKVYILMTLTSPFCPIIDIFIEDVKEKIKEQTKAERVDVDITFDPPWSPDKMNDAAKKELGLI